MKTFLFNALLLGVLLGSPNMLSCQTPAQTDTLMSEQECGGYAPQAYYHFVTDVDGMRLRQKPSLDAPVLEVMPKNKRLIWHGGNSGSEFEITLNDGTKRKGYWCYVSVWKGGGQSGWVFSGTLSLLYAQVDAEFDGGLDALCCDFFDLKALDSLEFERQFALAPSKREKAKNEVFPSPDGRYGLRQLTAKDKMAGLEFTLSQGQNKSRKVTVEDLAGGTALRMAWTAAGHILVKWSDNLGGIRYYDIGMPKARP